jgi:hypothetical protein
VRLFILLEFRVELGRNPLERGIKENDGDCEFKYDILDILQENL